jgi:hypothetical protein
MAQKSRQTSRKTKSRKVKRSTSRSKAKTTSKSAAKRTTRSKAKSRKTSHAKSGRRWSKHVTETSDALDLRQGVFKLKDPKKIAASLKRSAEDSRRRKSDPYRSAMSMLTFYINRGGKNLSGADKKRLDKAKDELREQFGRA